MFYVVSYDIPDDNRRNAVAKTLLDFGLYRRLLSLSWFLCRNAVAKTLLDFGSRVQYSVFECIMDDQSHQELMNRLVKIVVEEEDKIRVYALCAKCEGRIAVLGRGEVTKDKEVYIL